MAHNDFSLLQWLLASLWFFLPAYFANMAPVFAKWLKVGESLAKPIDAGKKISNQFILGPNKTWRGVISSLIVGAFIAKLQSLFIAKSTFLYSLNILDYERINPWIMGLLLGLGVTFGDLAKSFIKRRLKKKSGERFIPWDQLDLAIGGLIVVSIYFFPPLPVWIVILVLTPFLGIMVNLLGYSLKIKEAW